MGLAQLGAHGIGGGRGQRGLCSGSVRLEHGSKVEESLDRRGPLSGKGGRGDGSARLLLTAGLCGNRAGLREGEHAGWATMERKRFAFLFCFYISKPHSNMNQMQVQIKF